MPALMAHQAARQILMLPGTSNRLYISIVKKAQRGLFDLYKHFQHITFGHENHNAFCFIHHNGGIRTGKCSNRYDSRRRKKAIF
jgi:hypothetical protein